MNAFYLDNRLRTSRLAGERQAGPGLSFDVESFPSEAEKVLSGLALLHTSLKPEDYLGKGPAAEGDACQGQIVYAATLALRV